MSDGPGRDEPLAAGHPWAVAGPPYFLTRQPRWLLWRTVARGGLTTKVPRTPQNTAADVTDARTWATYAAVAACRQCNPALFDGAGIVLGDLGDDRYLCGLDLDSCLDDEGNAAEWAWPFLALLPSYAEISPSGRGLKIFFHVAAADALAVRGLFGIKSNNWGCKRPIGANGPNHGPGVELYFARRFFAVTGQRWIGSLFEGAMIDRATLERLAEIVPKARSGVPGSGATGGDRALPDNADLAIDVDLLQSKLAEAFRLAPKLKARWFGDVTGLTDTTGSGFDFSLGAMLKAAGFSFTEMRAALMWCDHGTQQKHADDRRHWQRIWDRTSTMPPSQKANGVHAEAPEPKSAAEPAAAREARGAEPDPAGPGEPDVEHRPPGFTDEDLALRFAGRHRHDLRYVAAWNRWLLWTGTVWETDETLKAFDLSRAICREAAAACTKARIAAGVASAKTVAAVERLARADRRHAATAAQWDADVWALNTPDGVVEQQTGALRPHLRTDYMTKIAAVAPGGECPLWHKFLDRITANEVDLKSFLQRAAGYAATGITCEHALFFCYGKGANGKGVFLNTITKVLGSYAVTASMEVFTETHGDRHPTELARLRGARLVAAQETEEGRRWAESKIKALTGGDPVAARFMRADFFTFQPQFKPFFAGNHKPGLRSVDEAIGRRVHLIPFTVTIPQTERDKDLPEKLRAEWPGILRWIIDGCLAWQQIGLAPPRAVTEATDAYMAAEDAVGIWLEECCNLDANIYDTAAALFGSWKTWAERSGEQVGTKKRFGQALETRDFAPYRLGGTGARAFMGLQVRPDECPRGGSDGRM